MTEAAGREVGALHGRAAITSLVVALLGIVLVCIGIAIDAYRHDHGSDPAALISLSNPGAMVAFGGFVLVATGVFAALWFLTVPSADSEAAALRRGLAIAAAGTIVAAVATGAIIYVATSGLTFGHEGHRAIPSIAATPRSEPTALAPGANDRVVLRGTLTIDGAPLNAEFLGVRVIRGGLATACQKTIPAVTGGRYEITVLADAELRGCGAPGAELLLWTYTNDAFHFADATAPWPGDGETAVFAGAFSSEAPGGASEPATEFKGQLLAADGTPLPGGAVIEAYAGQTRCGVTSMRYGNETEMLYTLIVAGPDSVDGCGSGVTLTFRVNGAPVAATAINDLAGGADGHELDLIVE